MAIERRTQDTSIELHAHYGEGDEAPHSIELRTMMSGTAAIFGIATNAPMAVQHSYPQEQQCSECEPLHSAGAIFYAFNRNGVEGVPQEQRHGLTHQEVLVLQ
eukprot:2523272-Amphidinium_carterae.1